MLGYIWAGMMAVSFLCAWMTGRMETLSQSVLDGADKAVQLVIAMAGVMCLWTGVMKIADKAGLTTVVSKMMAPVLSRLMPDYDRDSPAMRAVSANLTANLLGLGNAATPLGLAAMREMQKTNRLKAAPNNSMVMFVVLNTASLQIIPTTIAALRQAAGSVQPYAVLPYIWMTSVLTLAAGILLAKLMMRVGA